MGYVPRGGWKGVVWLVGGRAGVGEGRSLLALSTIHPSICHSTKAGQGRPDLFSSILTPACLSVCLPVCLSTLWCDVICICCFLHCQWHPYRTWLPA